MEKVYLYQSDMEHIHKLNKKNGYGISTRALQLLGRRHQKANERGDIHGMLFEEARLTDINFHVESAMLAAKDYEHYFELLRRK